jgi:hypothetical protein
MTDPVEREHVLANLIGGPDRFAAERERRKALAAEEG